MTVVQNPIFTDKVIAKFNRMMTENNQLWSSQIQPQINDTNVAHPSIYGEMGLGAIIDYILTGDKTKASLVADILIAGATSGQNDRNWVRGYFIQTALSTYWIWNGISTDQQTALFNLLQNMTNFCMGINIPNYTGGFRVSDTDQTLGQFGGIWLSKLLFPNITFPNLTGGGGNIVYTLGNLDTDTGNTVRDAIAQYFTTFARGGEWIVGGEYNMSDDTVLAQTLWLASKHITGVDHFPEIAKWMNDWALVLIHDATPDWLDKIHWGDDQTSDFDWWDYAMALNVAARCLEELGSERASWVQFMFNQTLSKYGDVYPNRIGPEAVLWFDPYATAVDYRPLIQRTLDSSKGVGQVTRHDGWNPQDTLFWSMAPNNNGVDHQCDFCLSFQIYDNGKWVLDNPISYGPTKDAPPLNAPLYGGYSSMDHFGSIAVQDDDNFLMHVGATSGQPGWVGQYNEAPAFVNEATRIAFYLPKLKALVVLDRMNLDDPRKWDSATIAGYPAVLNTLAGNYLKEVLWHAPSGTVSFNPTGASWNVGNTPVRLDCFSTGGNLTVALDNEDVIWGISPQTWNIINAGSSRIRFGSDRAGLECILSVFQWGLNQTIPVVISSGNIIGFKLNDCQVLFNQDGTLPNISSNLTSYLVGKTSGNWGAVTQLPIALPTPAPLPSATPPVAPQPTGIPLGMPTLNPGDSFIFGGLTFKLIQTLSVEPV